MIEFTILGVPFPKGRPRAMLRKTRQGPMIHIHTPQETIDAENALRKAVLPYRPRRPLTGPLRLDVVFVVPAPARLSADRSKRWPEVRPDIDNFFKLLADAMNEILWEDDGQICAVSALKVYGHPSRTEVRITPLSDADEAQHELWEGIANGNAD